MIVAFAGRIGSGKSTLSKALASQFSWAWTSFGDAVRREARARGLSEDREVLQDLGNELIGSGWEHFCAVTISQSGWDRDQPLVVDGVRHRGAFDSLRDLASPEHFILIFVDTPLARRRAWLVDRGMSETEIASADAHSNENELYAVMAAADVVLDNSGTIDAALDWIDTALRRLTGKSLS
jgi:dephospho-CoA kinase